MTWRRKSLALAGWLLLTFGAAATGVFVSVDGWYAGLTKPAWNPPGWVFGPVWTTLYVLMATAAWLVWLRGGWAAQGKALRLYLLQWTLNALWTPLFFGLHQPGLALVEVVALYLSVLATLVSFWRVRRSAAVLLIPYVLWLTLATALNFTIWQMNHRG
jgi:translocator protein